MGDAPDIFGIHHVRLPVSDVMASRDWYIDVLGFEPLLVYEEEDGITGVALEHRSGVVIGLHEEPPRAAALAGFAVLALAVPDIDRWVGHLAERGVPHGTLQDRHLGRCLQVTDPDGLVVELHTLDQPSDDEA